MIVAFHGFMGTGADFIPLKDCLHTSMDMPDFGWSRIAFTLRPHQIFNGITGRALERENPLWLSNHGITLWVEDWRYSWRRRTQNTSLGLIVIGGTPGIADHQERSVTCTMGPTAGEEIA